MLFVLQGKRKEARELELELESITTVLSSSMLTIVLSSVVLVILLLYSSLMVFVLSSLFRVSS